MLSFTHCTQQTTHSHTSTLSYRHNQQEGGRWRYAKGVCDIVNVLGVLHTSVYSDREPVGRHHNDEPFPVHIHRE